MRLIFCQRNITYCNIYIFAWALFLPVDVGTRYAKVNIRDQSNPEIVEYDPINRAYKYMVGLLN